MVMYAFQATFVKLFFSFCNLTTIFAVHVNGIDDDNVEMIPFIVLGTSVFGLLSVIFIVFLTSE